LKNMTTQTFDKYRYRVLRKRRSQRRGAQLFHEPLFSGALI
jgi:hypothetical protein